MKRILILLFLLQSCDDRASMDFKKEREKWMSSCMTDRKYYECELIRSGQACVVNGNGGGSLKNAIISGAAQGATSEIVKGILK